MRDRGSPSSTALSLTGESCHSRVPALKSPSTQVSTLMMNGAGRTSLRQASVLLDLYAGLDDPSNESCVRLVRGRETRPDSRARIPSCRPS